MREVRGCWGEEVRNGRLIYLLYLPPFCFLFFWTKPSLGLPASPRPRCPVGAAVGFTGSPPPEALILSVI